MLLCGGILLRKDIIYYLWLQCVFGVNNIAFKNGMSFFNTAEVFYNASEYDYKICDCFTPNIIKKLMNKDLSKARKILNDCERLGYDIIAYNDELFSDKLRAISAPPVLLYVNGKMPELYGKLSVAMVGSRNSTSQGLNAANDFAFSFAESGATVVSGGAFGVDTASHRAVLNAYGTTISVLGCGIDVGYPMENIPMYEKIAENGAVVSEFPPGYPPIAKNFPLRNRIICGLSDCTLIVQAGEKSGALITANDAIKEGRKLFSIPGSIFFRENKGSNELLRLGYSAAIEPNDILNWYDTKKNNLNYFAKIDYNEKVEKICKPIFVEDNVDSTSDFAIEESKPEEKPIKKIPTDVSEASKKVFMVLSDEPVSTDYISAKTGMPIHELLSALTELKIYGYIESDVGGKYNAKG